MNISPSTPLSANNALTQLNKEAKSNELAAKLEQLSGTKDMGQIKEVAQEFEAVFISQMLSHMFSGIEVDDTFGGGKGEEIWRGMMVEEYGKSMAKAGGIGLSTDIQRKMIELQGQ